MARIVLDIGRDGVMKMDAQGFTGGACKDATRALEEKFRGAAMESVDKPEMAMVQLDGTGMMEELCN